MTEVINLAELREPVAEALEAYGKLSDGHIRFDLLGAADLSPTPEKPNSARSVSPATLSGGTIVDAYTIVFRPGDGTGDGKTYSLDRAVTPHLPRKEAILPRRKAGMLAEVGLSLCASDPGVDGSLTLHAGNLCILGSAGIAPTGKHDIVVDRIGPLGQTFPVSVNQGRFLKPTATVTVGSIENGHLSLNGERKGDPHAIYNPWINQLAVVCFLGIPNPNTTSAEDLRASNEAFASLQSLNPQVTFLQ